jgi:hypothetical protein
MSLNIHKFKLSLAFMVRKLIRLLFFSIYFAQLNHFSDEKQNLFSAVLIYFVFSQELLSIVKYAPSTYGAGNQKLMISQDENHYVFFANNEGLLEYIWL